MPQIIEFELTDGLTDSQGQAHTTVEMRALTNRDIINLSKDVRLRELSKMSCDIPIALIDMDSTEAIGLKNFNGSIDPIKFALAQGALLELNCVQLGQVIVRIGSIKEPGAEKIKNLSRGDIELCISKFNAMNNPGKINNKEKAVPLEQ